jgi:hypothetical protein
MGYPPGFLSRIISWPGPLVSRKDLASRLAPLLFSLAHRVRARAAFPSALVSAYSWLAPHYILYTPTSCAYPRRFPPHCLRQVCGLVPHYIMYAHCMRTRAASRSAFGYGQTAGPHCISFSTAGSHCISYRSHLIACPRLLFAALWRWPNATIRDIASLVPFAFSFLSLQITLLDFLRSSMKV